MNYFKRVFFTISLFQFISLILSINVQSWNFDGEECINGCEHRGFNQYWCYTKKNGWRKCLNDNSIRGKTFISFKNNMNSNYEMVIKTDPEYENICVTNDPFCLECSNGDSCLSNELIMENYFKYLSTLIGCQQSRMLVINPRNYQTNDPVSKVLFRNVAPSVIRLEAIQGTLSLNSVHVNNGKYLRTRRAFTEWMLEIVKKYRIENCCENSTEIVDTLSGYPIVDTTPVLEKVTRGTGNVWKDLEVTITKFFSTGGVDKNIIWKVICFYGTIEDLSPQRYWLSFLFYSSDPTMIDDNFLIEKVIDDI